MRLDLAIDLRLEIRSSLRWTSTNKRVLGLTLSMEAARALSSHSLAYGGQQLLCEVARQLALGMTYEDTIRVAELKVRGARFERVREEVGADRNQIVEIVEFMHPRVEEIADTMPAPIGRWLLRSRFAKSVLARLTSRGRMIRTYVTAQAMAHVIKLAGDDVTRANVMRIATSLTDLRIRDLLMPGVTINTTPEKRNLFGKEVMAQFNGERWDVFGDF
jgi:hypothetical protein